MPPSSPLWRSARFDFGVYAESSSQGPAELKDDILNNGDGVIITLIIDDKRVINTNFYTIHIILLSLHEQNLYSTMPVSFRIIGKWQHPTIKIYSVKDNYNMSIYFSSKTDHKIKCWKNAESCWWSQYENYHMMFLNSLTSSRPLSPVVWLSWVARAASPTSKSIRAASSQTASASTASTPTSLAIWKSSQNIGHNVDCHTS